MEKKPQRTSKEKRRNMERRKEKSRDAARCRRSKEQEIFTDLFSMLPLSQSECISHLDKASIIRIAISYLKIRAIVQSIPIAAEDKNSTKVYNADSLFLNALEGFLLVTTTDGDIVFISENVNRYLGLSQVDILGQSIYELSHPCDHAEIKEMLSTKDLTTQKSHFLRMKCTLTSKGRNVNIKSASYKVIQYSGRLIKKQSNSTKKEKNGEKMLNDSFTSNIHCDDKNLIKSSSFHFVAIGEPISHPANIEVPLGQNTFLSKHSLDMKFTYADERIIKFFGYNPNALIEKSLFDYHHAQDSTLVRDCFKSLFHKGQSQTERYRFLACGGGYAWVLTQATVIYNNNTLKPLSVVCVNFVISGIENKDEIYSLCQLEENDCDQLASPLCETLQKTHDEEDDVTGTIKDGYVSENSPQRLIEKLNINATSSCSLFTTNEQTTTIATVTTTAPTTIIKNNTIDIPDESHYHSFSDNSSAEKNIISENPKLSTQVLHPVRPVNVGDFLINSASTSPLKLDNAHLLPTLPSFPSLPSPLLITSSSVSTSSCSSLPLPLSAAGTSLPSGSPASSCVFPVNSSDWLMNEDFEEKKSAFKIKIPLPPPEQVTENANTNLQKTNVGKTCSQGTDTAVNLNIQELNHEKVYSGVKSLSAISETPKPSTINVFVPFTEDMNKGFLGFTNDDTELTMLKEDPEDLTHLAPTAGGVCVPLDATPINYVIPDVFEEIMLSDCTLLPNDNKDFSSSSPRSFFSYKDELETSSRPHSPILTQNEDCNISSFCHDGSSLHENPVNHFLDFNLIHPADDIDDLSGKTTSLIPLTLDQDQLLPFVTNDFMWGCSSSSESSAWSSVSNSPSSNSPLSPHLDHTSSLAKLLTSEPICNYDGGGKIKDGGGGSIDTEIAVRKRGTTQQIFKNNQNGAGTKHIFNTPANRIADRNFSNSDYVRTNNSNHDGNKSGCSGRGSNASINVPRKADANNIRDGGKRKSISDIVVGSKRALSETSNRANSCKRSKQTAKMVVISRSRSGDEECNMRAEDSATVVEAIPANSRTNSVLMNLLVSGCDINAGYKEDCKEFVAERICKNRNRNESRKPVDWPSLKKKIFGLLDPESTQIPSLMDLTEQDYAVNAPSSGELLQGSELLKALECPPAVINLR